MAVQPAHPKGRWPAIAGFEWDAGNQEKCRKHGLSLAAIEAVFHRPVAVFRDHAHSQAEARLKAIGQTDGGRHVVIVFTLREQQAGTLIRPISARYMHAKEVAHYEKETAKARQR